MDKVSERVLRDQEKLFWCAEPFQLGVREGSYHVHALIQTRHSAKQIEDWYSEHYGRADVRRYNPALGAVGYVSKYMMKAVNDYDMLVGHSSQKNLDI
jgi:hypothetical protein